jgi:hypothetical protein
LLAGIFESHCYSRHSTKAAHPGYRTPWPYLLIFIQLKIKPEMIVEDGEGHQIPILELVVPLFEQLNRK